MEMMVVNKVCSMCGGFHSIVVDYDGYRKWKAGEGLIQDLLKENTDGERELLISGVCENCFDELFSFEEEEENVED